MVQKVRTRHLEIACLSTDKTFHILYFDIHRFRYRPCVFTPRSWRQAALKETSVATFALCWLRSCRELDGLDSWSVSESVYDKI